MMSEPCNVYYIGEPANGRNRGQDSSGSVNCIVWVYIEPSAVGNQYGLWSGGCRINSADTIDNARKSLHAFARARLTIKHREAQDEVRRIEDALELLGDDPANLERFHGTYKRPEA